MFNIGDYVKIKQHSESKLIGMILVITDKRPGGLYQIQTSYWGTLFEGLLAESQIEKSTASDYENREKLYYHFNTNSQPEAPEIDKSQINMECCFLTLNEAFKHDFESKKPKYRGQSLIWLNDGKCPTCGELGRYHLSTPICSKHGRY